VTPKDAPPTLVGTSVVLTVTVDSTDQEVLAVPVAALSVAADGSSRVEVKRTDGTTRFVAVTPGLTAKGLVAVSPAGPLAAGDLVIVGTGPSSGTGLTAPGAGSPGADSIPSASPSPSTETVGSTDAP
jgi:hypothetical protein